MTALISATELITRYYSIEKLAQCCFNVRPTSETLVDIKPTFGEYAVLAGKALTVNMREVNCFQSPMITQPFVSQHKAHMREMVNYFLIDVAQVYRVYMTCELALNAAMGMKRILLHSGDHIVPRILTVDYTFNIIAPYDDLHVNMLPKLNLIFFKKIDVTYIKIIFKDKIVLYLSRIIHSIHATCDIDVQMTS